MVHSSPAYGVDDFLSCRRYGMKDEEILNPVQGNGKFTADLPYFGGQSVWDANPKIVEKIRESGALLHAEKITHSYMFCWRHKTPVIYRATTQWFAGMDEVPGYRGVKPAETLRTTALRGIDTTRFYPSWGKSRLFGDDRQPTGLDAFAATFVGGAADAVRRQGNRRAPSRHAGPAGVGREQGRAWRHRDVVRGDARGLRRRPGEVSKAQRHARRLVRFRLDAPDGDGWAGGAQDRRRLASAGDRFSRGSLSRRLRPASRLVPFIAARFVHEERRAAVQGVADARLRRRRRGPQDVEVEGQRRRAAEGLRHAGRGDPAAVDGRRPTTPAISRFPTRS